MNMTSMDALFLETSCLSEKKMGNSGVDFCGISEENFDRLKKGLVNMFPVIKVTEVKA